MDHKSKIERLKAIKEEFALKQARLEKARKLEEAANATHLSTLLENDLEQAELILAAKDVMAKLQDMAEDLAKISAHDVFPLADKMKGTFGPEAAQAFEHAAQNGVTKAMAAVRGAKDALNDAILQVEGKLPANDMAADNVEPEADVDMSADDSGDAVDAAFDGDDFAGSDAASGPEDEPLGRAKKESVESTAAPLIETVDLAVAGKKLIEREGLDSLVDWLLTEAAAAMPADEFKGFAKNVASKAAQDPAKLAGWIGKKKYGAAAMAQLSTPTVTSGASLSVVESDVVVEGKSYRHGEDENDVTGKRKASKAVRAARRDKYAVGEAEELDERKYYDDEDEEDLRDGKRAAKDRFLARDKARKAKYGSDEVVAERKSFGDEDDYYGRDGKRASKNRDLERSQARKAKNNMTESEKMAHAVAKVIEANVLATGKGSAAQVVKEFAAKMGALVEGDGSDLTESLIQAFESAYGMKPAAYSIKLATGLTEAPLNTSDQKKAAGVMGKIASKMATDKSAANKPVSSMMQGLDGVERATATKMMQQMKKDGQDPKKIGDFVSGAESMVGDQKTNEDADSDPNGGWVGKVEAYGVYGLKSKPWRKEFKSGAAYMRWLEKNEGNVEVHGTRDNVEESLEENINAAHWPVDEFGQYKGKPVTPDLAPLSGSKAAKTEETGEAKSPKVEEPKVDGAAKPNFEKKAEEPKGEKAEGADDSEK